MAAADTPPTTTDEPALPDRPEFVPPKKSRRPSRRTVIIIAILVGLLLIAGGLLLWRHHQSAKASQTQAQTTKPAPKLSANVKTTPALDAATQVDVYDIAQFQGKDMAMFKSPITIFGTSCDANGQNCDKPIYAATDLDYYKVGQTAAGQGIFVMTNRDKGEAFQQYLFIEDSPGHYVVPAKMNPALAYSLQNGNSQYSYVNDFAAALSPNYQIDTKTAITAFDFAAFVNVNGLNLKAPFSGAAAGYLLPHGLASLGIFTPYDNTTLPIMKNIGSVDGKDYYEVTHQDAANYKVQEVYATINNTWSAAYVVDDPVVTDSDPLSVNWQSGDNSNAGYITPVRGCGSPNGYVVPKGVDATNATVIGQTKDGQDIYELASSTGLFNELYQDYYNEQSDATPANLKNLTKDQFQAAHAVILSKNALGEYMVHERSDMFIAGGCGKPVVYLYPTVKTDVSVKVGADVKVSVPHYDAANGWQHVTAYPGGKLSYQGTVFDSLFWEGTGHGPYPGIASGTVVARKDAVATIRQQLAAQGFNAKETADFLTYWQPKLPATPYVRLTWLTTDQMNTLAPLTITPRPQTVIRTFLDFEGLQQPISLPAQTFTAPARNGFTVVEWGGLLQDGSLGR